MAVFLQWLSLADLVLGAPVGMWHHCPLLDPHPNLLPGLGDVAVSQRQHRVTPRRMFCRSPLGPQAGALQDFTPGS